MANRFFNPNQQFLDGTGTPYAGGSLTFYTSGTSSLLATYSDKALSIANTNPVVLDSAGRAGNIFLQNLAYKVVLSDVNNNVIWTEDPVFSSDFSAVAQFQSGNGSPNGVLAGSAGSSTIPASSYWDATNDVLYVCTQTGNAATAVWTAINSGSASAIIPPPQGYLTPVTGTPIINADALSVTTIYYTPYIGNLIPIYNGTSFTPTVFAELLLTLSNSAHAASTIYDVFVFNNNGVLTLVTGPSWAVNGAGVGSRGSGAGTTQLTRVSGLWVNAVSMSARNGATTYTVPANQGTYVGSIFIDAAAGQISCHRSIGQSRKWGVWNAYNRVPISLRVSDPTASWAPTPGGFTWRFSDASSANAATAFCGLPEEIMFGQFSQILSGAYNNNAIIMDIGIGINSSTAVGGTVGEIEGQAAASAATINGTPYAFAEQPPIIGIIQFNAIEQVSGAGTPTFFGTSAKMLMTVQWRG